MRWFDNEHPAHRQFWHPVASLAEIEGPGPHPVRLLGEQWVLVELDRWTLLPATCPHRLAPLSAGCVVDGALQCGYHGWRFNADGACVEIPALGDQAAIPPAAHIGAAHDVQERYGLLWACIDEPLLAIPDIDEWADESLGHAPMPPQLWRAGAAQMVDNFLDVAHFPFTHLGTIGNPDDRAVGDIEIVRDGLMFDATYGHTARSIEHVSSGAASVDVVDRVMHFRCWAPHHLLLSIDYGPDGRLVLLFFHQPVDRDSTRLYCIILAENIVTGAMTADEQIAFQFEVAREDRSMLELLTTKGVSLDAGAEVHTRADRTTLEYRRLLADVDAAVGGGATK